MPVAFWIAFAVFAGLFGALTPRLRALVGRLPATPPDPALRVIGAAIGGGLDATKIAAELERIADAAEVIAEAAKSLAKSEEQGTARLLESLSEQVARLALRP
ncbi:hypothetical protein NS365_04080 [Aureimonas ureilytica]|uniref:Uncharacterized protein n=1 Tax=Aureimonas ureilytica TaxID=401562 RepID=A0A175RUX5_9HYPH|nr:hypothetical protein NS365_04080 [Aureimonas ureilytica]